MKKTVMVLAVCALSLSLLASCSHKKNDLTGHTVTTIKAVQPTAEETEPSASTADNTKPQTSKSPVGTSAPPVTTVSPITTEPPLGVKTPTEVWHDYETSVDNLVLSIEKTESFGQLSEDDLTIYHIDGGIVRRDVGKDSSTVTDYLVTAERLYTYYYQESGRWYKTSEGVDGDLVSGFSPDLTLVQTLMNASDVFDDYDSVSGKYPIKSTAKYQGFALTEGGFEIGDGKYTLYCTYTDDLGVSRGTRVTFENFGKVQITLPDAQIKVDPPVTAPMEHPENAPTPENVLRKINNAEKLTCDIHYSYQKDGKISFIDYNIALDGAVYKFAMSNGAAGELVELYTDKYDDFTYNVYKKDDGGVWNVSSIPSRNFKSILPAHEGLLSLDLGRLLYSENFTEYDRTRGTYTLAEGVVIDCSLGDITSAYLEIGTDDCYVIGATVVRADGGSAELSMMFYGIGRTTVDLPAVAVG